MLDPTTSLSFSIYSNKGVYALLLGSGVSRPAKVPTGWEIVLDLISKYAHIVGEEDIEDPEHWYREKFDREPDYSELINELSKSPSERSGLLRSYFEPSDEEREQGDKLPTIAHRSIAELALEGYIRIVITTNFDRLIERSLQDVGVSPVVLTNADSIKGAPPLAHSKCTVLKVHGDYLDTRIRNTPSELSSYHNAVNSLLDEIFDKYGLIVCGWSGEWDVALRDAISRSKNRRYTLYWASRGPLGDAASEIVSLTSGEVIQIDDADTFFRSLREKVAALSDLAIQRHPISPALAAATVKMYLADAIPRIRLHDLVVEETEKLYTSLSEERFPAQGVPFSSEELVRRVGAYQSYCSILQEILITGCRWGIESDWRLWAACIERIANAEGDQNGLIAWLRLRRYPAMLLLYSAGLACLSSDGLRTLSALFAWPKIDKQLNEQAAILEINAPNVMEPGVGRELPGQERHHTPVSDHLFEIIREPLRRYIPDDLDFERTFDRFEYLLALAYVDRRGDASDKRWGPIGSFGWRHHHRSDLANTVFGMVQQEAETAGESWDFLSNGLFNESLERFFDVKRAFDQLALNVRHRWL